MKVRKIIFGLAIATAFFGVVGCKNNDTTSTTDVVENDDLTSYEKVKKYASSFSIENKDEIIQNIFLPKSYGNSNDLANYITIEWSTNDATAITPEGFVTRSKDEDKNVELQAIFRLGNTAIRKSYDVVVKKIPSNPIDRINEVINTFVLYENNYIDRDIMVLPRTGDFNGVYISWETENDKIIDLEGNVYRTDTEQHVKLTATFSLEGMSVRHEYDMTVGSKKDDSPAYITENDSRILRRFYVNDVIELVAATSSLEPGDAVILNDGEYRNVPITITDSGTEEHPIFLFAKNPGQVQVTGESLIKVEADYVTVANLYFVNGYPSVDTGVVNLNGNHLRFTNNKIKNYEQLGNDFKWVSLTGKYHEIDRNTFDGKKTGGSLLTIWRNDLSPQYHTIYLNEFKNYSSSGGGNGYETIRIGTSTYSQSNSFVLLQNNIFEEVNGEIEIVSIKSGRTIVKGNTFRNSVGLVTCRHGKNNLIEDNVFLCNNIVDTGGIRMYDSGHIIRNNYIENVNSSSNTRAGIVIHSGVNDYGTTTTMNLQWVPYNILIENNTIVGSRQSILFGGKYVYPANDITVKGNYIVSKSYAAIRFDKVPENITWVDNHIYANGLVDQLGTVKEYEVDSGMNFSTEIPELNKNENGLMLDSQYGASGVIPLDESTCGITW